MMKKLNIFNVLLIIAVFAFVMRLVDLASFPMRASVAEEKAPEHGFEKLAEATPAEKAAAPAEPTPKQTAAAAEAKKEDDAAAKAGAQPEANTPPVSSPYGEQGFSASEVEILQSLSKRREELDKREQQIGQREALLKAAGGEVDRKIAELNKIKAELEDLLNKQKTAEDERINSLVKIYENMKPKDAANIFNTLEMDVLLPVISKISERKASPILAAMDPEKARQVTIKLAEQRRLPQMPGDAKKDKGTKSDAGAAPAAPAPKP